MWPVFANEPSLEILNLPRRPCLRKLPAEKAKQIGSLVNPSILSDLRQERAPSPIHPALSVSAFQLHNVGRTHGTYNHSSSRTGQAKIETSTDSCCESPHDGRGRRRMDVAALGRQRQTVAAAASANEVNSVLALDSFVVNLQDPSGNGYLRVSMSLGLASAPKEADKETPAPYLPRLRDTILGVLGTRTVDELLTPDGKTKLKDDLLKAINASVPDLQCKEVYFTEFLVQH